MKLKQVLFTITISAITTLAVIWGYGTFFKESNNYAAQQNGVIPANYKYAGLTDGKIHLRVLRLILRNLPRLPHLQ